MVDCWFVEFICDWLMIYRIEDDMNSLVKGLDVESIEVLSDDKNEVVLLKVCKLVWDLC